MKVDTCDSCNREYWWIRREGGAFARSGKAVAVAVSGEQDVFGGVIQTPQTPNTVFEGLAEGLQHVQCRGLCLLIGRDCVKSLRSSGVTLRSARPSQ